MAVLGERIAQYGDWRQHLARALHACGERLEELEPDDPAIRARIARMVERLANQRITIALVAEFSRGKSELINALFFPDSPERIVPSSAGRTTMCPTEIGYDAARPGSIRLLPIETRARPESLSELRDCLEMWEEFAIPDGDMETLRSALAMVQQTRLVVRRQADALGFHGSEDEELIEVPRWRHAIVNFAHPVLAQGFVLVDTPGLNAIGAEPELTLRLIPESDAVVFVLAADAGVTLSDIEVWRRHISPHHGLGRFVVLNKIDGLWDDLRTEREIDAEIARQVETVSGVLGISTDRIFPVSAQKGLLARVRGDERLLTRSRIGRLEAALASGLVARQQEIIAERLSREFDELVASHRALLLARRRGVMEQVSELEGLRGRNGDRVRHMEALILAERAEFERSLRRLQGLRAVFSRHARAALEVLGGPRMQDCLRDARERMRSSHFSHGLRGAAELMFARVREDLTSADAIAAEIGTLMVAMYREFGEQHGLMLGAPTLFSLRRHQRSLDRIEQGHERHFGGLRLALTGRAALTQRFFETAAAQVSEVHAAATRDLQAWLRTVLAPVEAHVREHQMQLRRRLEAVGRVLEASETLESRIAQVTELHRQVDDRIAFADQVSEPVRSLLRAATVSAELEPA